VVLLVCGIGSEIIIIGLVFLSVRGVQESTVLYVLTNFIGAVVFISLTVTGLVALIIDAKRIQRGEIEWEPQTGIYALSMFISIFILPMLVLPITLAYVYQRRKYVGISQ
ncbi:MAG: hypothetical protein SXQ77_12560, partial [Halobacteria archaeon]|nr:hypothetical protein [Halobacteria archaeon]